jgi:uncharacterized membrane protein
MRKLIIALSAGLVAAVTATVLFTIFHKSYNDYATECADALARHVKGKPAACSHISKDDYETLQIGQALHDSDLVGDDGHVRIGN